MVSIAASTALRGPHALWAFSRPHTLIGTSLSVWALYALARGAQGADARGTATLLIAWLSCLAVNIYIVGLNQLFDVEIDRVNKPELPLASGALTPAQGTAIVGVCGATALVLAGLGGPLLFGTVSFSALLGTLYSAPPARWKRYPVLAALCIFVVRGPVANLGLYLHFRRSMGAAAQVPVEIWALTSFMIAFGAAIALLKDVPDIEGDRRFRIGTFAVRFGASTVLRVSQVILTVAYSGLTAAVAASGVRPTGAVGLGAFHCGAVFCLWIWPKTSFYRFIWRLFFLEYLLFPLVFILGSR